MIIEAIAAPVEELAVRYPHEGLAYLDVDLVRGDPPVCGIQPWPREEEPAHAVVFRLDGGRDLSGGTKKRLAAVLSANWIVLPARPS